ncbi:MAG: CHAD domain-containing protein [Candidatus Promineifilaceae bacterium]|nr:CHAD domain-containing protein [Candidatus Promineifilaceae bacterium]
MAIPFLSPEGRDRLQAFVDRSPPETAYWRRAQIVLMVDQGRTPEAIASELELPINRVRQFMRAFDRQGLQLFPATVLEPEPVFDPDESIDTGAREIISQALAQVEEHTAALETEIDPTSVHETRKAIRRLRTATRLFAPYFEQGLLAGYRRRLRKAMRRMARSRDATVFLEALESNRQLMGLTADEAAALDRLAEFWQERRQAADDALRAYLTKGKYQQILAELADFCAGDAEGALAQEDGPSKVRHVAPVLLARQVAQLRMHENAVAAGQPKQLHTVRIQAKELRYAIEFFEPAIGPAIAEPLAVVRDLLAHLGAINDARVHLRMLGESREAGLVAAAELYEPALEMTLRRLLNELPALWDAFDQPVWRRQLATAVAVL